jgi:hypothetical protein
LITPEMQVKAMILASCLLGFVAAAFAQDAVNYSGKWRAQVTPPSGKTYDANVVIEDKAGTWQAMATSRNDPCVGRPVPIAVLTATSDELTFRIKHAEAIPGCVDSTVRVTRVDDKTMKGTRGTQPLVLVRD